MNKIKCVASKHRLKPRSTSHFLLATVCAVTLFVAQTFGSKVAFFCFCGGKAVLTQSSHCHGPHGPQCHTSPGENTPHNDDGSGDRRDHQSVTQDIQSRLVDPAPEVAPPELLLQVLQVFDLIFPGDKLAVRSASPDPEESPPAGITVARTVVLLI